MTWVGQPLKRRGDPRLLTGGGCYVADLRLPGQGYAAFVRSTRPHARVLDVDTERARRMPGVLAVFTGQDTDFAPLPLLFPHPRLRPVTQIPLGPTVHHVGEPVAMVVAQTRYQAEDACDAVTVTYQGLPSCSGMAAALGADAPRVHQQLDKNLAAELEQRVGQAPDALRDAPVVVSCEVDIARLSCLPMETRGLVASWGPDGLVVYAATQTPHMMRRLYSELLGVPEAEVRVVAPDVGGGFGAKEPFYAEDLLIAWAAKRVGRPVAWIEDRLEHLQTAVHEREQRHHAEMGVTRDGHILAVIDDFLANTGAYVPWGVVVPIITSTLIPGPYRVPHYACHAQVAYTNTTPLAPYRGAGRPQAALVMNRLLDLAADRLGLDPAEIRQRNFLQPEEFPVNTGLISREGTPMFLDSGNYPELLRALLDAGDYAGWRHRQSAGMHTGRRIGIGMAVGIENTAMGPHEGATVSVESSGEVTIRTGAASQGQGHDTTLAQIAADVLRVSPERIRVLEGDTALIAFGTGTFASRTAVVAGSAVQLAAEATRDKALRAAAHLFEADPRDLELENGEIRVNGVPGKAVQLGELALLASGPHPGSTFTLPIEPGLEATRYFAPQGAAYAASAHLAVVEVDPDTGAITILQYVAAHDCGTVLNPRIVEGQIIGAAVAGIGSALLEEVVYDPEGQLLTGSLMDYLVPGAMEMPDIVPVQRTTTSPLNPLGAKGAGESGTIPAPAALLAAVADAAGGWGAACNRIPIKPMAIHRGAMSHA